jgi:hypothetical protein
VTLYVNLDKMPEDDMGLDDLKKAIEKFTGLMLAGERYVTLEYIAPNVSLSELVPPHDPAAPKEEPDGSGSDTGGA